MNLEDRLGAETRQSKQKKDTSTHALLAMVVHEALHATQIDPLPCTLEHVPVTTRHVSVSNAQPRNSSTNCSPLSAASSQTQRHVVCDTFLRMLDCQELGGVFDRENARKNNDQPQR